MNTGTISLIASVIGTIGLLPVVGQIVGIWLGKKTLREGDNRLARAGIIVGWAGLALQACLACVFLGLVVLGVISTLSNDTGPAEIPIPESTVAPLPSAAPVTVEPSGPPVIPTVASFSAPALLGVECEDAENGARITRVVPGTPAEQAGMKVGDVIIAIGNHRVASCSDLRSEIRTRSAGEEVEVSFRRGNEITQVTVVLAGR